MFKTWTLEKALPYILLVAGIIGYIAAFIIMFDKIELLKNPKFVPGCDINPIVSCGSVMKTDQSNAFGFPNPFIGLGAFPVVAVIGGALLAGAKFKRWFWLGLYGGYLFAIGFVHWLFFQTVYRINALCPYCMVVWVVVITSFWYLTLYMIDKKHIKLPDGKPTKIYKFVRRHHLDILITWFLIIFALIMHHFWYYFGRNL